MGKHNAVANSLNKLLADYAVYYQKVRNYHWNVKGQRFFDLHEEFEKLYLEAATWVDDLAERVARLKGRPASTYKEFLELARIEEDEGQPSADQMVRNLRNDIVALNKLASETHDVAEEHKDLATQNLIEDIVQRQEEHAWMLSSWLSEH